MVLQHPLPQAQRVLAGVDPGRGFDEGLLGERQLAFADGQELRRRQVDELLGLVTRLERLAPHRVGAGGLGQPLALEPIGEALDRHRRLCGGRHQRCPQSGVFEPGEGEGHVGAEHAGGPAEHAHPAFGHDARRIGEVGVGGGQQRRHAGHLGDDAPGPHLGRR